MSSHQNTIRKLWCRQRGGELLNPDEQRTLNRALQQDRSLREEFSDDATSEALLRSLRGVVQSEDEFVQAVLQKTVAGEVASSPESGSDVPTDTDSVNTQESDKTVLQQGAVPLPAVESRGRSRRTNRTQRSQQWTALTLTAVLFASIALTIWMRDRDPSEGVASVSPPSEEQVVEPPEERASVESGIDGEPENAVVVNDQSDPTERGDPNAEAGTLPPEGNGNGALQMAANDRTSEAGRSETGSEDPAMEVSADPAEMLNGPTFVTLTRADSPVWERDDEVGSRWGDEQIRLFGGVVELTFDDGAVVTLEGPVEFQPSSAGRLRLLRGRLTAVVPGPAIGFTVQTPTSEVIDLGTVFDVSVKETGASDVTVSQGEIEVSAAGLDSNKHRWKLVPRGMNRATFFETGRDGQDGPVAAAVSGANGEFHGTISVNGKTAEFRSVESFEDVRGRVMEEFRKSQDNTRQQWREFVDSMQQNMQGTMQLNGMEMSFGNLQEIMRLQDQMRQQLNGLGGQPSGAFRGSIQINGRTIKFSTREEYEAARRTAFGPAATFGAGDVFRRRNESSRVD